MLLARARIWSSTGLGIWIAVVLLLVPAAATAQTVIFAEDFEGAAVGWYADSGLWQIGEASIGPVGSGRVAGTVLDGNYAYATTSRFISPGIDLPDGDRLWIRFAEWHHLNAEDGVDYGRLLIKYDHPDSNWVNLSGKFTAYSPYWSEYMADVTEWGGQRVRFGFLIDDEDNSYPSGHQESYGLYIDDVRVLQGHFPDRKLHTFDDSNWLTWEGWYASNGCWQIGAPTSGCTAARSGRFCAGTGLDQNYLFRANSRLISPEFELSGSPVDGQVWLTFWSWHSLNNADGWDNGVVQVQPRGGDWETVASTFQCYARCWSPCAVDLSAYAGETIRIAFLFDDTDNSYPSGHQENHGWFVDAVAVREGRRLVNNPDHCRTSIGGWSSRTGTWQMGTPTTGPAGGHDDAYCWGTHLDGNYGYRVTALLESAPVAVPPETPVQFQFQQWFSLANTDGVDYGELRVVDEAGGETTVLQVSGYSNGWSPSGTDLTPWAGQEITLRFYLVDVDNSYPSGHDESTGWYLDDFEFVGLPTSTPDPVLYVATDYSVGAPVVHWVASPEVPSVCIYACRDADLIPSSGNLVAIVPASAMSYEDPEHPGYRYFYFVAALDEMYHESEFMMNPSAVEEPSTRIPARTAILHGTYPNPFNPATEVGFTLTAPADTRLRVYDLAGRLVDTLVDGWLQAGRYDVPYRPDRLASGTYLLRLEAGGDVKTCKFVLVR